MPSLDCAGGSAVDAVVCSVSLRHAQSPNIEDHENEDDVGAFGSPIFAGDRSAIAGEATLGAVGGAALCGFIVAATSLATRNE